jgi:hypothetical protein
MIVDSERSFTYTKHMTKSGLLINIKNKFYVTITIFKNVRKRDSKDQ